MSVVLADVDEPLLARLVRVATTQAAPDEVTPPLGQGWTPQRVAWLEDYHRRCREGLRTGAGEQTWAVLADGEPVGAVRLQRTDEPGVLTTGIWLARPARGRGVARAATDLVLARARAAGARAVSADTAATNLPAQALLRSRGFTLTPDDGRVRGRLDLDAAPAAPSDAAQPPTVGA